MSDGRSEVHPETGLRRCVPALAGALAVALSVSPLPTVAHDNVMLCGPIIAQMKPLADRVAQATSEWRRAGKRYVACLEKTKEPIYATDCEMLAVMRHMKVTLELQRELNATSAEAVLCLLELE